MKHILGIVLLLGLYGCSIKEAPLKVYTLHIDHVDKKHSRFYVTKTIKVNFPLSLKEKINQNMHFSYSDAEQGSYQNAQWSNNLGQLIQGSLIETMERSGLFKGVISYASTAQEDYRLESTIYAFSHRIRGNASDAVVSIQISLVDANTGKLVDSHRFSYTVPTVTKNAKGYADATNIALSKLSEDLLVWLDRLK
ncbi:MAG: membrane integrity-associated transporter subunit PqiC [Campylobacterales bacterium]|nr:membrane integrity-associated transporter subunit PqiC [Campylobacterales bacterium]